MDHIDIPKEHVVSMEEIGHGIEGLRIVFVNVFGITHEDGSWTLMDCGLPYSTSSIKDWAEKKFSKAPNAIFLTHGHFDHIGAVKELAEHWNVAVYAHPLEKPYLTGQKEYPAPNFAAGGGMMSLMSPLLPRAPIDLGSRLRLLQESSGESTLAEMPGWQIIHTPGHTPGHVSLFREADRLLLPGDAFCTTKPESFFEAAIAQQAELHGPPSYFTSDWNQARESVQKLAVLEPLTIAPGHGRPVSGENIPVLLEQLAARFDRVAVPDNRRDPAA